MIGDKTISVHMSFYSFYSITNSSPTIAFNESNSIANDGRSSEFYKEKERERKGKR